MHTAAPDTMHPLENPPKKHISKSIYLEEHPIASKKQSGCKQSPLKRPSTDIAALNTVFLRAKLDMPAKIHFFGHRSPFRGH